MEKKERALRSNLKKADARGVTPADLEEIPEVTDEEFARMQPHVGGVPVRRGRPPLAEPKEAVKLRLPPRVLQHFRRQGPGWQTRISDVLSRHVAARRLSEKNESTRAKAPKRAKGGKR